MSMRTDAGVGIEWSKEDETLTVRTYRVTSCYRLRKSRSANSLTRHCIQRIWRTQGECGFEPQASFDREAEHEQKICDLTAEKVFIQKFGEVLE